jgi:hypothetical protein
MSGKKKEIQTRSEFTASSIHQIFKEHVVLKAQKSQLPDETDKNLQNLAAACNRLQARYLAGINIRSEAQKTKRQIEKSVNFLAEILPASYPNYAVDLNKIRSERAEANDKRRMQFRSYTPERLQSLEALDALIKTLHQARSPAILESISLVPGCLAAPEDYDVFDVDLLILFRSWFEKIKSFGVYRFIAKISEHIKEKEIDPDDIRRTITRRLKRDDYYPSFAYDFLEQVYFDENPPDPNAAWDPEPPLEAKGMRRNRMLSEILEEAERTTPYDEREL